MESVGDRVYQSIDDHDDPLARTLLLLSEIYSFGSVSLWLFIKIFFLIHVLYECKFYGSAVKEKTAENHAGRCANSADDQWNHLFTDALCFFTHINFVVFFECLEYFDQSGSFYKDRWLLDH